MSKVLGEQVLYKDEAENNCACKKYRSNAK